MSDNADRRPLAPHRHLSLRHAVTAVLGITLLAAGAGAARATALDEAAEQYRAYMIRDVDQSFAGAKTLQERVKARDLGGAQQAWIHARVGWERSEVFTSGFVPDLDEKIDAWPNAQTGFHAIEARIFGAKDISVGEQTDALVFYLADLDVKVHDQRFNPQGLLNGVARLAYEVGENKSDGGESPFSGTSLDDMRYNAYGIQSAYNVIFAAALKSADPALADLAEKQIAEMKSLLDNTSDLKSLDQDKLRTASEELVVSLQNAAPKLGLRTPTMEEIQQ